MTHATSSNEDTMTSTPSEPPTGAPHHPAAGLTEPADYEAPIPTERTIKMRNNLPVQAYRFAAVSLKMTRMILRSHG
jgi:hypothetical protein